MPCLKEEDSAVDECERRALRLREGSGCSRPMGQWRARDEFSAPGLGGAIQCTRTEKNEDEVEELRLLSRSPGFPVITQNFRAW